MKSALARKPTTPIPEPESPMLPSAIGGQQNGDVPAILLHRSMPTHRATERPHPGKPLGRIFKVVTSWFVGDDVPDETPPDVDAREIEALERHIRKFTDEHRFTGFPC